MNRETRVRFEGPALPEGWRSGTHWLTNRGISRIYTSAPANCSPYDKRYDHVFVTFVRITQERFVTEWEDVR